MCLYAFQPASYGNQWFVVATDREAAIGAVRAKIASNPDRDCRRWHARELEAILSGLDGARIDEHAIGEVVEAEIC